MAREYCKIFSAEARTIESFGPCLEVIPVYLIFRPANVVPYATVETDLTGAYQKYSSLDHKGRLDVRTSSTVEQKCCAFQHWIFQWTNGNLLLTRLEGVDTKITNIGFSVKSTGYQGLSVAGNPQIFEQFVSQHKCNYFCGLFGLRSLKVLESLATPTRSKGSRSPLLQRKTTASPSTPQNSRKAAGSPRVSRKVEQDGCKTPARQKDADPPKSNLADIK
uniref:Alpha-type protein kinase domain-containing protein n=1 Tax=Oryzias sinensis TaxID=183150 RepID=A0A8C7Z7I2_9TELE